MRGNLEQLKITIDTSVISDDGAVLDYLVTAHQRGQIDVAVASRFKLDKENDRNTERAERQRQIVSQLYFIPSTIRLSLNYIDDEMVVIADDTIHQQLFCLFDIDPTTRGGRHTLWDVDHLYSHMLRGRDIFLTFDKQLLRKRTVLKEIGACRRS